MTAEQCKKTFADFLSNDELFASTLEKVITEWKHSCEHYLTNKSMNRIAWLGQAAVCYAKGIPSQFSSGWSLLSTEQQEKANDIALVYLNKWFANNDRTEITMDEALSVGRQIEIY